MQPQSGWKSVRLVKIEGTNHLPDVLPKLFPRITFSHNGLSQTLSPIATVGFLGYFEDEFSHALKSKLPMPERQVQAWQMSADALVGRIKSICLKSHTDALRGVRLVDRESIDLFME